MGEMRVMDRNKGDLKVVWDPDRPEEVEAARAQFDQLRGKGYMAYLVRVGGRKGEQITEFDPAAESLIMAPALRGGSPDTEEGGSMLVPVIIRELWVAVPDGTPRDEADTLAENTVRATLGAEAAIREVVVGRPVTLLSR